ncbi:MAG: hypothetical protein ACSHX6_04840 [Akkermansiaceae bacterium]
MKPLLLTITTSLISFSFLSCTNENIKPSSSLQSKPAKKVTQATTPLVVNWLIESKDFDDMSLVHQVSLIVNGETYLIDDEVYSLKQKSDYQPHSPEDIKSYQSISGYNFEWHVSSANFYVKQEQDHLNVYLEESSDENEGKATTRKVKTIHLHS